MIVLILFILLQSVLLVAAQTLLKISVGLFGKFAWSWQYFKTVLTTWQFAASGICALSAMLIWMYVLKKYCKTPFGIFQEVIDYIQKLYQSIDLNESPLFYY